MKQFGIFAIWLTGVILVSFAGFSPDPYLQFARHIPPPYPYPISGILWVTLFISAQCAALAAILRVRTYKYSWGRAAFASVLSIACFVPPGMAAMHSPPYFFAYIWWLLGVVATMLSLLLWSVIGALHARTVA